MDAGGDNENEGQDEVPGQPMNLVEGSQERVERLDSAVSSESDPEFTVRRIEPWEADPVQLTALEFEFYNRMRTGAALRAREDLISVEASWRHYVRNGDSYKAGQLYEVMQDLFPFLEY